MPKGDELCPTGPRFLKGSIFQPFREGNLTKNSRTEFREYMNDRLKRADENKKMTFPELEAAYYNHGDLSPTNIKLLPDGRVAFFDQDAAVFASCDWDVFALRFSHYDGNFAKPLIGAFEQKGL